MNLRRIDYGQGEDWYACTQEIKSGEEVLYMINGRKYKVLRANVQDGCIVLRDSKKSFNANINDVIKVVGKISKDSHKLIQYECLYDGDEIDVEKLPTGEYKII
jgi:hypothetical protein